MEMQMIRDEIKLKLTGGIVDIELEDSTLDKIINSALREVQRYINTTKLVKMVYKPCLDLTELKVSNVVSVYRTEGYLAGQPNADNSTIDPMYVAQWQILSGGLGGINNIIQPVYDLASWNESLQLKNTLSTDLNFTYDKYSNHLYVNCAFDKPKYIAVRYIPRFDTVEEITSDYWIDILVRMAVALTKQTLGRVYGKFKQTNALWGIDSETLLNEGNAELEELRTYLTANNVLIYPKD